MLIGPDDDFLPPAHLSAFQQRTFVQFFCAATGARRDSANNVIKLLMEAAGATERGPFRTLTTPAEDGQAALTPRERSYALTKAAWSERRLRAAILANLPLKLVEGFVIEQAEATSKLEEPTFDVFSLHAVGPGFCRPIGWRVASLPPRAVGDDVEQHSESEQRCVIRLVKDLLEDLEVMRLPSPFHLAPVFSSCTALGENFDLRMELARLVPEYGLQVGAEFQYQRSLRRHPYDQVFLSPTMEDLVIPETPQQIFNGGARRDAEYAGAIADADDEPTSFWIVRPHVVSERGSLLGRRPERRVGQLLEIAGRFPKIGAAERLGLARMRSANAAGLQRVAVAMSALQLVLEPVRVRGSGSEGGA